MQPAAAEVQLAPMEHGPDPALSSGQIASPLHAFGAQVASQAHAAEQSACAQALEPVQSRLQGPPLHLICLQESVAAHLSSQGPSVHVSSLHVESAPHVTVHRPWHASFSQVLIASQTTSAPSAPAVMSMFGHPVPSSHQRWHGPSCAGQVIAVGSWILPQLEAPLQWISQAVDPVQSTPPPQVEAPLQSTRQGIPGGHVTVSGHAPSVSHAKTHAPVTQVPPAVMQASSTQRPVVPPEPPVMPPETPEPPMEPPKEAPAPEPACPPPAPVVSSGGMQPAAPLPTSVPASARRPRRVAPSVDRPRRRAPAGRPRHGGSSRRAGCMPRGYTISAFARSIGPRAERASRERGCFHSAPP